MVPPGLERGRTKFCLLDVLVLTAVDRPAGFATRMKSYPVTRLETRTKESNVHASLWVVRPYGGLKEKVAFVRLR